MMKNWTLTVLIILQGFLAFSQNTQTVRGKAEDEITHNPIPGVNIMIVGTNIGTATDVNGNFRIPNVPVGRQTIKIKSVGYQPQQMKDVVITAGKEFIVNMILIEDIKQLDEIEVKFDRKNDKALTANEMSLISSRAFNSQDTKKFAGALGDPARMVANYAGVVGANDSRNDIVVRGNSPLGSLWQLEGINIPNPNHFGTLVSTGGPVSMLNNNNIDKSDFLTGAFAAQYGNATSSVFDISLRNGNDEKREMVIQTGVNGLEIGAEGPIAKDSKSSYIVNFRYSTLSLFKKLGVDVGTGGGLPIYQDLNFKLNFVLSNKSNITVFGLAGNSKVDFLGDNVDTTKRGLFLGDENANTLVRFRPFMGGVGYSYKISKKVNTKLTFGYSKTYQSLQGDSISLVDRKKVFPNREGRLETQKFTLDWKLNYKVNAQNAISVGANIDFLDFDLFNRRYYKTYERTFVDSKDNTALIQGFTQWKHRFSNKLTAVAGIHFQNLVLNGSTSVEPRFAMSYQANSSNAFTFGYGLHSQMQNITTYFIPTKGKTGTVFTNRDLGFTKSQHFILGYEKNITDNLRLKVETYHQSLSNVPVETRSNAYSVLNSGATFIAFENDSLVNKGTGTNYGLELTLERFFDKGLYFLVTASVFDASYKGSDGIQRNTTFNNKYAVNVLAGKEIKIGKNKIFSLNFKMSSSGGKYLTPLDLKKSQIQKEAVYDESRAFSEQQTGYFRIDIKPSFRKEYAKSTFELSVDLQNITNSKNVFLQSYNPRINAVTTEYQQKFFPVPSVRYTF
jgi:CarboxypepD_reg-like domain/TonB-dependent Receptor Plug Domain